ncbi:hypothetical protein C9I98_06825 [Photobacterium sanctipauli]|uniref:Lipoprotein n=1 Tax=Photobacterium sanctipauli TaxID=1342794 RepID=A0A2T3NW92_9GAMM|nr:hypothetical protein [Photobacterium sanctipauli]PSW20560.1 hypothetical protein C9I98_06825 [Photobacterium sanctipauli]
MRYFATVISAVVLSACANITDSQYAAPSYPTSLDSCIDQLNAFKSEVKRQGVQDAQVVWDNRYPHLAFNRFSQAQLSKLETRNDQQQWLNYTASQAKSQRHAEYNNLIDKQHFELASLDYCADKLTQHSRFDTPFWQSLEQSPPTIDSSYEPWYRFFGVFPISKQVAKPAIENEKKRILDEFNQPTEGYSVTYAMAPDSATLSTHQIQRWFDNALVQSDFDWPQLSERQINQLLHHYAPVIEIESASLDDKPGRVEYSPHLQPEVNTNAPTIYLDHSYTEFHGKVYLQLNYSLWFANRTPESSFDPYAGAFDGVVLRLTLDHQGQPLVLDSIHHCGCYHMVFALQPQLVFRAQDDGIEKPLTFTKAMPVVASMLNVTLSHGEHMIKQVEWRSKQPSHARQLLPLHYDALRSIPTQKHYNKSLFDQRGFLLASERLERIYLWPFGVPSPGTMRQVGHHATAFIGERHFDDATVLEALLQPTSNEC